MRTINVKEISDAVASMAIESNLFLPDDVKSCIEIARENETSSIASHILEIIENNIEIAKNERIPLCQDTGLACVFLEIGQDLHIEGGDLREAINEGVKRGYDEGFLRKSVVSDPLRRENTKDNTPAHIVMDMVSGDKLKITFAPKGFGSENMSRIKMLTPAAGEEGVKEFIIETVKLAGGNPCPPIVVGVGIGGTFDSAPLMAKKALMLPLDHENEDPYYAEMEKECLEKINSLNIGPQGFGGNTTALAVNIITAPTHIAGLPVAVNINCHVQRHKSVIL